MATEIKVPTLGESVAEATVASWTKQAGEAVTADEILCELETDKVTVEVPAPASGVLTEITAGDGVTVEPGAVLGVIDESASAAAAPAKPADPAPAAEPAAPAPAVPATVTGGAAMPAAAKMMREAGLDPANVAGSGKGGRILKEDVVAALAAPAPASPPAPAAPSGPRSDAEREERVRMTRLRRTIANRLKEAQNTAAMLTTFNEVDMTAVMGLRAEYKADFEKKHGCKLGFMSFFVKACVHALKELPAVNAEIDGDDLVYKNYYHVGIAVGTAQGLVVPVVRDADAKSFADIELEINEYGRRARDGKLTIAEMQGGTFTITNGGVYGSLMSTPILNPPQSGILGMHKIQQRPMVVDGEIKARPMMYLALSYDHRIIDGREAVTFLVRVKDCLEDPRRMLLDL